MFKQQKPKPRKLTPQEIVEIQEINRIAAAETFKADHFEQNTMQLNVEGARGQALAQQQRKIATLMQQLRDQHVMRKLVELGYSQDDKVTIDMHTGEVTLII